MVIYIQSLAIKIFQICSRDSFFFIKNVPFLKEYNLKEQIPYPRAKAMLLIDSEDPDEIKKIKNFFNKQLTRYILNKIENKALKRP